MLENALIILWAIWIIMAMVGTAIVPVTTIPQKTRKIYMRTEGIVCFCLTIVYIARVFVFSTGTNIPFILLFGCISAVFMLVNPPN